MQTDSRNIYVKSQQTTSADLTRINGDKTEITVVLTKRHPSIRRCWH
jgi:hypothetical protein